ncbi:kinesin-like protein [Coemansia guatemalensis]|uniref:Kinesin-like protein n=1 Tax=Coemansia guatemalensis TaxID=2761395 RepID=A0A9W8I082_9FUNG|nr:kinesin-like protein [Coemansia guatemalensis]
MSTKMNFGPEWYIAPMRSVPTSNRGTAGTTAIATNGNLSGMVVGTDDRPPNPADRADLQLPVYTHERMIELFRPRSIADGFVIDNCVFSEASLDPVSLTPLSSKEQELLSGLVNSAPSRRYNVGPLPSAHPHARNGGTSQKPHGHASHAAPRSRPREGDRADRLLAFESANGELRSAQAAPGSGLPDPDNESENLWANQTIVRNSVGSFGADGVFRMDGDDDAMALGESDSRSAHADTPMTTSRTGAVSQIGISAPRSPQPGRHSASGESQPGDSSLGVPSAAMQQRHLIERAERLRWWYCDPQGNTQGPFSTAHMQEWCSGGYFSADLQVCHEGGSGFEPLGVIISRAGRSQDAFIYAALAFVTQSAATLADISTPTTPAPLSRVGSAARLTSAIGAGPVLSSGRPSPVQNNALQPPVDQRAAANGTPGDSWASSPAPAPPHTLRSAAGSPAWDPLSTELGTGTSASGAGGSEAAQLSALLQEQLQVVTAISERQHSIIKLQEQQQQALAKLMQEVAQKTSSIHYKAQMDQIPVQPEILFALQQHAQATKESLRHELLQLSQIHIAHIAQLEAKTDPVIREMLLQHGAVYALNFIGQRLQELSSQIPSNQHYIPPQNSAGQTLNIPASSADLQNRNGTVASEIISDIPAPSPAQSSVPHTADDLPEQFDKLNTASNGDIRAVSSSTEKSTAKMESSSRQLPKPAGQKVSDQSAVPAAVSVPSSHTDDSLSGNSNTKGAAFSGPPAAASAAPWSTAATGSKSRLPKKSLLQIQQEEEAEAKKTQHKAAEERRSFAATASQPGTSYADRLGNSTGSTGSHSLAAIMEEQYRESASAGSSGSTHVASTQKPGSQPKILSGHVWAAKSASKEAALPATASTGKPQQNAKSATKPSRSTTADVKLPSMDFLQWCYTRLSSLRGIDTCKFIEMLLTFPMQAPEATLEIISEQVYAYSTTLNGRAFAEDFAKRRRKDYGAIRNGSAQSASPNWAQQLGAPKDTTSTSTGYAHVASKHASNLPSSNGSSSFQVVGKKGRK